MCQYFEELDAILGSRTASQLQVVLENETGATVKLDIAGKYIAITFCYGHSDC